MSRGRIAVSMFLVASLSSGTLGQSISVERRKLAVEGTLFPARPTYEAYVAAGAPYGASGAETIVNDKLVAVFNLGTRGPDNYVAFSVATPNGAGGWTWAQEKVIAIPNLDISLCRSKQATVAYNRVTGDFVAVAKLYRSQYETCDDVCGAILMKEERLAVAHYKPADPTKDAIADPNLAFLDGWTVIASEPGGQPNFHAQQIIAGDILSTPQGPQQEFYIVYQTDDNQALGFAGAYCLRSTDGGYTWIGGQIPDTLWPRATTAADGRIYVVNVTDGNYTFFEGTDQSGGGVQWRIMKDCVNPANPLTLTRKARPSPGYTALPAGTQLFPLHADLQADPLDPNSLYFCYHDLEELSDSRPDEDTSVFFCKLTRQVDGQGNVSWCITQPVRVNDQVSFPDPTDKTDEFLPRIWVTRRNLGEAARIHIVFYSDRRFDGQFDNLPSCESLGASTCPKFDMWYARSDDAGATWTTLPDELLSQFDPDNPSKGTSADLPVIRYGEVPLTIFDVPDPCLDIPWILDLNFYFGLTLRRAPNSDDFDLIAVYPSTDWTLTGSAHRSVISWTRIRGMFAP